jgi:hypothetical protein
MNHLKVRVGMRVYIKTLYNTKNRHGTNSDMEAMVGKTYTVKEVRETYKALHRVCVYIKGIGKRGYTWSPEDLQTPTLTKAIKGGKFDPSNLICQQNLKGEPNGSKKS